MILLYEVTNDPSFRNYGINTYVELRRSFLLELRDQVFTELLTILPFGITGFRSLQSYQRSFLSELRDQHICGTQTILLFGITRSSLYGATNDPSFRNYGINTSVELRQSFLLEL